MIISIYTRSCSKRINMTKIAYGIQSFGLGHYSRSVATLEYLKSRGYEIEVFASGQVYRLMKEHGYTTHYLSSIVFKFKDNHINYSRSVLNFLLIDTPMGFFTGYLRARRIIKKTKPDIIITDFEIHTAKVAYKLKIPLISIDNLHAITHTDAPLGVEEKYQKFKKNQVIGLNYLIPVADHFFILSFFPANPVRDNVSVIQPVLRDEVLRAKKNRIAMKDHFIVYMSITTNTAIINSLKANSEQKFIVYGFNEERTEGNIQFKKNSVDEFIYDLASSKGAVSCGGFSFMSESIFLGKPVLGIPIEGQFEMIMNCTYLNRFGYGDFVEKITPGAVKHFIDRSGEYRQNLLKFDRPDNSESFRLIEEKIEELIKLPVSVKK